MDINTKVLNEALNTLRQVASLAYGVKAGEQTGGGKGNIGMIGGVPIKFNTKFSERWGLSRPGEDLKQRMIASCDELRNSLNTIARTLFGPSHEGLQTLDEVRAALGRNGSLLERTTIATVVEQIYKKAESLYGRVEGNTFGGSDTIWTQNVTANAYASGERSNDRFEALWTRTHNLEQRDDEVPLSPTAGFEATPGGTPGEDAPKAVNLMNLASRSVLDGKIAKNERFQNVRVPAGQDRNYTFAKYLLYFRPDVEKFGGDDVERFLNRVGDRLDLSTRVNKWANTNDNDSLKFRENLFNCLKSDLQHRLFTNAEYCRLFSELDPDDDEGRKELEQLGDDFVRDLEDLMTRKVSPKVKQRPEAVETPTTDESGQKEKLDKPGLDDDMRLAKEKERVRLEKLSQEAPMNGSEKLVVEEIPVDDVFLPSGVIPKSGAENVEKQPKAPVRENQKRGWTQVSDKWLKFFKQEIVPKLSVRRSSWSNPTDWATEGFRALVMCRLAKDAGFEGLVKDKFSPRAFEILASASEDVFNDDSVHQKLEKRPYEQTVGEFVFERLGNLRPDNPVSNLGKLLTGGLEGLSEKERDVKVKAFKEALKAALLS